MPNNPTGIFAYDEPQKVLIVNLLQAMCEDTVTTKASDIHIESDQGMLGIHQRFDGILQAHITKAAVDTC